MVVNKRKKVHRYRGLTTHGGGHRKKRRGAGSRGGRGNAGTGKRAGHKKPGVGNILGSRGFLPRPSSFSPRVKVINVGDFTPQFVEKLVKSGKATSEKGMVVVNLTALGYGKLLGMGETTQKLRLHVRSCSASAAEKVAAAGGEVVSSSSSDGSDSNVAEESAHE